MKVLGLDTSGYANAIGVVDGDCVLADFTFEARTDTLEKIVTHIDFMLKKANLQLEDIDGFGVGLGPGSWTGIRVGVTVGKILAFSTGKPICGVATLEILASQVTKPSKLFCPIISAGTRDTIYAAFYRRQNDLVERVDDYYVGDPAGLARRIKEPTILVGTGINAYLKAIRQEINSNINIELIEDSPRGASVALLALDRLQRGGDNALALAPLYLKESTARAFISQYTVAQTRG